MAPCGLGTRRDIADGAAFLLGQQASPITGVDLLIDGGVVAAVVSGLVSTAGLPIFD
jgi:NAD(P)-dependent dehydrogenase (short-subunit alcohol dehydrogenase family)